MCDIIYQRLIILILFGMVGGY